MNTQLKLKGKHAGKNCPVVGAIKAIVTESRLLVVRHLFNGPKGFNELMRESGINSKTLSATLRFLEENGIVKREVVSTRPFTVLYSLSTSGLELKPALEALGNWGMKWLPPFSGKEQQEHTNAAPNLSTKQLHGS
ncbi:MAG: helix-turn-helix domain-containing protein [Candidatus Bathyarchaeia archaeon]